MRNVLAMLSVTLLLPAAQADALPSLSVPAFSLQYLSNETSTGQPIEAAISLESTSTVATVIRLDSAAQQLATVVSHTPAAQVGTDFSRIRFTVAEGYVITGIEFSGVLSGELNPAEVPPEAIGVHQPHPRNQVQVQASYWLPGDDSYVSTSWTKVDDVTNARDFHLLSEKRFGQEEFDWSLGLLMAAYGAESSYYLPGDPWPPERYVVPASGYVHLTDPRLTIHTIWLVPEPGQWAMLTAGLVLLGISLRRRRAMHASAG